MGFLWSVLGFLVVMGLLVTIHEAGHFLVARWLNIKATVFSIGFGRAIWTKQWGETEFRLAILPLGGYVKFVDESDGEPIAPEDLPRAFNRQAVWKRFLVVFAGPFINLVFAWLAFSLLYVSGVPGIKPLFKEVAPQSAVYDALSHLSISSDLIHSYASDNLQVVSVNDRPVASWQQVQQQILQALVANEPVVPMQLDWAGERFDVSVALTSLDINQPKQDWLSLLGFVVLQPQFPVVIDQVVTGSAAAQAGLQKMDQVLSIDAQPMPDWQTFVQFIQAHPGTAHEFEIIRQSQSIKLAVTLASKEVNGQEQGRLGASLWLDPDLLSPYQTLVTYPLGEALISGLQHTYDLTKMSLIMLQRMVLGEVSVENLSGPLSIAQYSGQALQTGWMSFLSLLGLISLSLGVLNLLPIPVLDGGHLFFYLVEMIKGRPLSESTQLWAQKIGIFLLLSLTFVAILNDVVRITHE